MKGFKNLGFVAVFFLLMSSCTTDFELTANWQEIMIVYGLLDPNETTHYIRIQKAFLDEETNALQIAAVADSLYHNDSLTVTIENLNNGTIYTLNKINATLAGLPKDTGIFANNPHWLFTFNAPLIAQDRYQLKVRNITSGKEVEAETSLIENSFIITAPGTADLQDVVTKDKYIEWKYTDPAQTYTIKWRAAENGSIYQVKCVIPIELIDYDAGSMTTTVLDRDTLYWTMFNNYIVDVTPNTKLEYNVLKRDIFDFLANNLSPAPAPHYWQLDKMQFYFTVGGEELKDYIQIFNAAGGISEGFSIPEYSNINGGLGVFSSRLNQKLSYTHQLLGPGVDVVDFGLGTLDSLACSTITQHLRIAPDPSNVAYPFLCN